MSIELGAQAPKPPSVLPDEAEIRARWSGRHTEPLVDIVCVTFNHAAFIRETLHGFLSQETDFPFRVLVHDDASDDGTTAIVREFAERYPGIVECMVQTENQFSRGFPIRMLLKPFLRAKYAAWCDGDDYWLDPAKLSKQVGYLETHPECVISGHDAMIVDDRGLVVKSSMLRSGKHPAQTGEQLMLGKAFVVTLSMVYRNLPFEPVPELAWAINRDSFFIALMGRYGGCMFHDDISPGVYRQHGGGMWCRLTDTERQDAASNSYYWMYRYFQRVGIEHVAAHWKARWMETALKLRDSGGTIDVLAVHLRQWMRRLRGHRVLFRRIWLARQGKG